MRYKVEFSNLQGDVIATLYYTDRIDFNAIAQLAKAIPNCTDYSLYFTKVGEVIFVNWYPV